MKKTVKAAYGCTMVILYSICRIGWAIYLKYWTRFADFSDMYTEQYGQDALKAVEAAAAMPDNSNRQSTSTDSHDDLLAAIKSSTLIWLKLNRYIDKAYPEDKADLMRRQAGSERYDKAVRGDWSEASALMIAGQEFIAENTDTLLKGGMGMPKAFPAAFDKVKATLDGLNAKYNKTKGDTSDGATDKVKANNAIYYSLTEMLKDASVIFAEEAKTRQEFTYTAIRRLVTKDVVSGIHFIITDSVNSKRVSQAVIAVPADDETKGGEVNKIGALDVRLSKGVYTITVTAPGYEPYTGTVTVSDNVMHRVTIKLVKLTAKA